MFFPEITRKKASQFTWFTNVSQPYAAIWETVSEKKQNKLYFWSLFSPTGACKNLETTHSLPLTSKNVWTRKGWKSEGLGKGRRQLVVPRQVW